MSILHLNKFFNNIKLINKLLLKVIAMAYKLKKLLKLINQGYG